MSRYALVLLCLFVFCENALPSEQLIHVDFPAQSLGASLRKFADTFGLQLAVESSLTAGKPVPAIQGDYSETVLLAILLRGTGLSYRFLDQRTIAIVPSNKLSLMGLGDPNGLHFARVSAETSPNAAESAREPGGQSSAASAVEENEPSLEEVVVTARKRAENLQKTPVSVTVLSGSSAQAQNIRTFQDLRGAVPDLEVTPQGAGGANLAIRGLGQTSNRVSQDVKTGFYVNDMYVSRQEGNTLYFYDVDSLQVLKGPQGTLFGKNTTGGAVLLTTALPSADSGGYVLVRAGNYSRIDSEGAVNIPLADDLLTRISFRTDSARGFINHVEDGGKSNDVNDQSVRGQIRWRPNDELTVDFLGEYNTSRTDGTTSIVTGCSDASYFTSSYNSVHAHTYCSLYPILTGQNEVYGGATMSIPTDSIRTDTTVGGDYAPNGVTREGHRGAFNDTDVSTANLRINYQFTEDLGLKSVTTYRRSQFAYYNPVQNAPDDIYAEYDSSGTTQITEELNLAGAMLDKRLNFVFGLYTYQQKTNFLEDTGPDWADATGFYYWATNKYTSYATFGQVSFKITPALEITAGARYTIDRKDANSFLNLQTNYDPPCDTFPGAFKAGVAACNTDVLGKDHKQWSGSSPRFQISYQFTPDIFTYGSVSTGYNSGGFNQQIERYLGGGLLAYAPEKLTDYEVGLKTEWFNRMIRFNVTAFKQLYKDIQTNVVVYYNGAPFSATQTGASAREQGVEVEAAYAPTPNLLFQANGSILDQKFTSIAPDVTTITLQSPPGQAPRYTYSAFGSYVLHVKGALLTPSLNWRAIGAKPDCSPVGACYLPAYGLFGSRIDFKPSEDSPWTASLWGTNLLDKTVELSRLQASVFGVDYYTPGRPREFGVEFRRTF